MEEVDNIIIHTLKNIGCDLDEEVTSLKQFNDEMIVNAVVSCLDVITPGTGLPKYLPASMSLRLRTATSIAQIIQDLGYRGDMGYQTILYSNEIDTRRMFMFLVERLPRDTDKSVQLKLKSNFENLQTEIRGVIANELKRPRNIEPPSYYPFVSKPLTIPSNLSKTATDDEKDYWIRHLPYVTEQCSNNELVPSLLVLNDKSEDLTPSELVSLLKQEHIEKTEELLITSKSNNELALLVEEEATKKLKELSMDDIKNTIKLVTDEVNELKAEIQAFEKDMKILETKRAQILEQKKLEQESLENNVRQLKIRTRSFKLLPSKDENIEKLEELIQNGTEKLTNLANQWNKHRTLLIDEYRNLREVSTSKESESYKIEEEYEQEKQKLKELETDIANKNILGKQLQEEVAKLSKTVNRSAYTQRIMEIIGNIRKQCNEMDKILKDTKNLQKDINTLTGRLERSYFVTDEMIYRDAKQDETSRKAYKLLVSLHSDCSELIEVIKRTGDIVRETRDLQDQVDAEKSRDVAARIERITFDLEQVRKETLALQETQAQLDV